MGARERLQEKSLDENPQPSCRLNNVDGEKLLFVSGNVERFKFKSLLHLNHFVMATLSPPANVYQIYASDVVEEAVVVSISSRRKQFKRAEMKNEDSEVCLSLRLNPSSRLLTERVSSMLLASLLKWDIKSAIAFSVMRKHIVNYRAS